MHLNKYAPPTDDQLILASAILARVCQNDESLITLVLSRCRTERVAEFRAIAMYLIRRYIPDISTTDIGVIFQRDHSTVVCACKRVENLPYLHIRAIREQNAIQHLV